MAWVFESGAFDTLTRRKYAHVKIEISDPQPLENWTLLTAGTSATQYDPLPAPSFASPITGSEFIFNAPELAKVSSVEPSASGNSGLTIEVKNSYIGTDGVNVATGSLVVGRVYKVLGYTKVTHNSVDYLTNQYFTAVNANYTTAGTGTVQRLYTLYDVLNIDWGAYDIHLRISTKVEGGAYLVKFWGVVDLRSIELSVFNYNKPQTWTFKVDTDDGMQQLTKAPASTWMDASLRHADFDWTATNTFLTYVGDYVRGANTFPAGRYHLNVVWLKNRGADAEREYQILSTTNMRYIKIVDVLESIGAFLGYEAAINNGGSWADHHSWRFYYNQADSAGAGGYDLQYVGIDSLWVISAIWDGAAYDEEYTFFDPRSATPHSWKSVGDALEVLKRICDAFCMTYRTRVNSSGERYLEVIEHTSSIVTKTIADYSKVLSLNYRPNEFSYKGVEVTSPGSCVGDANEASNVTRGSSDTDSLKYDTPFTSCGNIRTFVSFVDKALNTNLAGARLIDIRHGDTSLFCTPFVLTGGSGKAAAAAYSVCMIMPMDNGDAAASDPANLPDYAFYNGTLGGCLVPKYTNTADPLYHTFIEVPAMAMALALYNDTDYDTDPVGFSRPKGKAVELELVGVEYDADVYPPLALTVTIAGESHDYVITDYEEKLGEDVVKMSGYTREV